MNDHYYLPSRNPHLSANRILLINVSPSMFKARKTYNAVTPAGGYRDRSLLLHGRSKVVQERLTSP